MESRDTIMVGRLLNWLDHQISELILKTHSPDETFFSLHKALGPGDTVSRLYFKVRKHVAEILSTTFLKFSFMMFEYCRVVRDHICTTIFFFFGLRFEV